MSSLPSPSITRVISGEPFIGITRGDLVESAHSVAACAVDASGEVILGMGDVDVPVYLRSTAKPFIAAAALAAGARERFGLSDREIAVMAASHSGEPFHVAAVQSILQKIGLPESALQCGVHAPYNAAAAAALERRGEKPAGVHNNCSGKHAGILALSLMLNADPATYLQPSHPAQRNILAFCARMSDESVEGLPYAVDGCGIPVYATPLRNAALSFMRLATLRGIDASDASALRLVREAMIAYPAYVAGTGEFDTRLMEVAGGAIACKGGAEGVHGTADLDRGIGLACKVIDGASRARAPSMLALLKRLHLLSPQQLTELCDFERPTIYNRAGRAVGTTVVLA